jgi:hypothetical protein
MANAACIAASASATTCMIRGRRMVCVALATIGWVVSKKAAGTGSARGDAICFPGFAGALFRLAAGGNVVRSVAELVEPCPSTIVGRVGRSLSLSCSKASTKSTQSADTAIPKPAYSAERMLRTTWPGVASSLHCTRTTATPPAGCATIRASEIPTTVRSKPSARIIWLDFEEVSEDNSPPARFESVRTSKTTSSRLCATSR